VTQAQLSVNDNVPDFVPFIPVCGTAIGTTNDPGLDVYREHFSYLTNTATNPATTPDTITITPNDGSLGSTVTCMPPPPCSRLRPYLPDRRERIRMR